jgi:hypothetical protein
MTSFERQAKRELRKLLIQLIGLESLHEPRPDPPVPGGPDLVVHMGNRVFAAEIKASSRTAAVAQAARQARKSARSIRRSAIPLVVVPHMGEAGARACLAEEVGYVDLCGNAHFEAPGLRIHVEGRPNRFVGRGRPSSPFAPKSSRIARMLLLNPERWWKQSDLATETRLGPGFVSRIVRRLEGDDLLDRDSSRRIRPRSPSLLLDAWTDEYDFMKHDIHALHLASRTGTELMNRVVEAVAKEGQRYAFTSLSAAWAYDRFATFRLVTIYLDELPESQWMHDLGARQVDRGANLWLVLPNDDGVFDGARAIDGIQCVSPVQTYLDLKIQPERSEEAAQKLRENWLHWSPDGG